jgi:integrase
MICMTAWGRIATVDQGVAIADRVPHRYRALVLVAAFGGLRWVELVGLRRRRVDLEAGTATVAEQLLEVNGAFSLGPPKSAAGHRTVTLPAAVVDALAEHLRRYVARQPDAFVFLRPRAEPADRGFLALYSLDVAASWARSGRAGQHRSNTWISESAGGTLELCHPYAAVPG